MKEIIKNEISKAWVDFKSSWKTLLVAIVLYAAGVLFVGKCCAQEVYFGGGTIIPMCEGKCDAGVYIGVDLKVATHYKVGAEITCAPGKRTKCGVTAFNAVGSDTERWGLWVKGFVGAEHVFTDEVTDHSYIVYGAGVKVVRYVGEFGLFVEPALGWNTYSAYIGPSAERGWYIIRMGVSINIGK